MSTKDTTHATTAALAAVLTTSDGARDAIIRKHYGADATPATVRTARTVSAIIHDGANRPTSGGSAVKVNAVLTALTGDAHRTPADALMALRAGEAFTPAALVTAVVTVSASLADAARESREAVKRERDALRAMQNDRSASVQDRTAAALALIQAEAADADDAATAKGIRAADALAAAIMARIAPDVLAGLIVQALGNEPAGKLADALALAVESSAVAA